MKRNVTGLSKKLLSKKYIIADVLSLVAIIVSIFAYSQAKSCDLYNRKTTSLSYSYDIINNTDKNYPKSSDITFVDRENSTHGIVVGFPTTYKTKIHSGLPEKRKIIIMGEPQYDDNGNVSKNNILDVASFDSADGTKGLNNEDLEYAVNLERIPACKLKENQYISYYFIVTYGIDGSKFIDCIWYQIFCEGGENQAFIGFLDSLDLEMNRLNVSEKNLKVDEKLLNNFFKKEVYSNYYELKQLLKDGDIN